MEIIKALTFMEGNEAIARGAIAAGGDFAPIVNKMNALAQNYHDKSRPMFCAKNCLVDEIVALKDIRKYLVAFSGGAYQNPKSICPQHHMILSGLIKHFS